MNILLPSTMAELGTQEDYTEIERHPGPVMGPEASGLHFETAIKNPARWETKVNQHKDR